MLVLVFYVPETHLEKVKNAIFAAGAGTIGKYTNCCWQVLGEGQFKPAAGSNPFIGKENTLEKLPEYRVEAVCREEIAENVKKALLSAHPYETPAWHFVKQWKIQ
jgi:hypothetical protein